LSIYEPVRIFDPAGMALLMFDRTSYLASACTSRSVLHVGCSDFPITVERLADQTLLHEKLSKVCSRLVGIDNSREGIRSLEERGFTNVLCMDAEDMALSETFDVVLAGDVLEHMSNPGLFLEGARHILNPSGRLIIGVPNAYSFNIVKYVCGGSEPTHKDHTYYFSVKTLSQLCSRYQLMPTRLVFTAQPDDPYETALYRIARRTLIKMAKTLAPSLIIEFQHESSVDLCQYFEWT